MDEVPPSPPGNASEMTRDLQGARSAFEERNAEASKLYHSLAGSTAGTAGEESGHQIGITIERDHMRTDAFMFGVIVPCLLLSCSTSFLNSSVDIVPSAVGKFLLSGALASACVICLACRSHFERYQKHYSRERSREEWELENYKEGEIREMVELYESKGMSPADAMSIIRKMSKYPNFFVDVMMVEELEMKRPSEQTIAQYLYYCFFPCLVGALLVSAPFCLQLLLPSVYKKYPFIPNDFVTLEFATYASGFILLILAERFKASLDNNKDWKSKFDTLIIGVACVFVPRVVRKLLQ